MKELEQRKDFLPNDPIETIYFGGGTPSLLTTIELTSILSSIYETYEVKTNAEITIEANPDDISLSFSKELKHIGFNRMSLGIQSFLERDMKYMHRAHTPSQSHHAIDAAQEAGFENISIDLIYGIPNTNLNDWKNNLDIIAAKNVQHLSCYALTVEPNTALAYQIKSHPQLEPKDADTILQMEYLIHHCKDYGFEQYEISNFSKPGFKSRHNNNYWQGVYYLGLGPSAHSYNGISRQWNINNNVKYYKALEHGLPYFETEVITLNMKYNEMVMTQLRTMKGLSKINIPSNYIYHFQNEVKKWMNQYITLDEEGFYKLTPEGIYISDKITSDLFIL